MVNEVQYASYGAEFISFYDMQRLVCDQMLGLKQLVDDEGQTITVDEKRLPIGIRKLSSFIITYYNYLDSNSKKIEIMERLNKITDDLMMDKEYDSLCTKSDIKSQSRLRVKYFEYIAEAFSLLIDFNFYLQSTIMAKTKDVKSLLRWNDNTMFFENLSKSRREVAVILSNYSFIYSLKAFKKVIAYYYTYGLFVDKKERITNDMLIKIGVEYLSRLEVMEFMNKPNRDRELLKKRSMFVQDLINHIYLFTNESLSYKGILPKINRKVYFDDTGI